MNPREIRPARSREQGGDVLEAVLALPVLLTIVIALYAFGRMYPALRKGTSKVRKYTRGERGRVWPVNCSIGEGGGWFLWMLTAALRDIRQTW